MNTQKARSAGGPKTRKAGTPVYSAGPQAETRRRILDAALAIEALGGFADETLVAKATGVRRNTVGRYLCTMRKQGKVKPNPAPRRTLKGSNGVHGATVEEMEVRLKALHATSKALGRCPTYDEICAMFPE